MKKKRPRTKSNILLHWFWCNFPDDVQFYGIWIMLIRMIIIVWADSLFLFHFISIKVYCIKTSLPILLQMVNVYICVGFGYERLLIFTLHPLFLNIYVGPVAQLTESRWFASSFVIFWYKTLLLLVLYCDTSESRAWDKTVKSNFLFRFSLPTRASSYPFPPNLT